jgi:hypothetical protein
MSFNTFCGQDPANAATYQKVLLRFQEGGGGGGVAAVNAAPLGNISIPNPLVPVVSVINPLNAVLNLGVQNITGTVGTLNFTAAGDSLTFDRNSIDHNAAANPLAITSNGQTQLTSVGITTISSGAAGTNMTNSGLAINNGAGQTVITQPPNTASRLATNIANVYYYADFVVDNGNSTAVVPIPPPNYDGQRLTCIARGIAPTVSWSPFGNLATTANPNGIFATCVASTGEVWIARTDTNTVEVWDNSLTGAALGTITLTGGSARCYVLYEAGGFMFIGGSFTQIGATAQDGLGRCILTAPYTEDKLQSATGEIGVDTTVGTAGVYALEVQGSYLFAGGEFTQFSPSGSPANFLFRVDFFALPTGNQTYDMATNGTNGPVYALLNTGYLFVGGSFTDVGGGFGYLYCATWDGTNWGFTDNNTFNGTVSVLENVNYSNKIFVGGGFTHSPQAYSCYLDYNSPTSANTATNLSIASPLTRGCSYYNGITWVNTQTDGTFSSVNDSVWVSEGSAGNASPSFFGFFGGFYVVGWSDLGDYYKRVQPAQSSTFTLTSGNFEFNNIATYTTVIISVPDYAQSWIGVDTTIAAPKWIQIGSNFYVTYS